MQRRAMQLFAMLGVAIAAATPARAGQADASMGVGLRIIAADGAAPGSANHERRRPPPRSDDTVVLSHGLVIAHRERVSVERTRDHAGRAVDVVTY